MTLRASRDPASRHAESPGGSESSTLAVVMMQPSGARFA